MNCFNPILRQIPRASLPVSVQLRMRVSEHPGTHVLDYLAKCEHAAVIRNRRDLVEHYHACWLLVFERVNGVLPLPLSSVRIPYSCPLPEPAPLKGWEQDKYSRPVRKVIGRRDERVTDENGTHMGHRTVLVLECGHEHTCAFLLDVLDRPQRRRCGECADPALAAAVERRRLRGVS